MTAPFSRRRIGVLLLATACDLGIWILACLFAASEFYRRSIVMGGPPPLSEVLPFQMVVALNWALFTPLVVLIAQRLPLRDEDRIRNGIAVLVFLPYLAVFRAAWGGAVLNLGEHDPIALSMISLSVGIRTHRYIAILAAVFFVYYLVDAQREAARRERQRVRAQTLLARAEIDELRTRLQPQFALRMLRHIGTVLGDQPNAADSLIVNLSGILRRSMGREGGQRIRLADELEHLDRCLDLCRAGGRFSLTARYVADDDVLASRVPALVLQPVIETVVLHLTTGAGGSVEVHCTREENETHIEVATTSAGSTFQDHQSAAAIRARLATLYGETASVQVAQRDGTITIGLRIPYEESATQDIPEEALA
jgi:two-component system, LytTR family, sensor kinase